MEKSTVSRRGVLAGAAVAAATAASGVLDGIDVSAAGAAPTSQFPQLRQAQFAKLVGQSFGVQGGRVNTTVTLASVTPLAMTGLPKTTDPKIKTTGEQFSLQFTGPTSLAFPQGIYTLVTPTLGSFGLLLVPVGLPTTVQQYQAVIVSV